MTKLVFFLFVVSFGHSAYTLPHNQKELSKVAPFDFQTLEESEEILSSPDVAHFAGLLKDLHSKTLTSVTRYSFSIANFTLWYKFSLKKPEVSSNFNSTTIIFPFHSFP